AATVVALTLAVTALIARTDAVDQRTVADAARMQAESRQIVAQALAARNRDPAVSTQLALAAYRVGQTPQARSALIDSTGVRHPARITGPPGSAVTGLSPDGSTLAVGYADGTVALFRPNVSLTEPVATLSVPGAAVYAVAFAPDGRFLATAGPGGLGVVDVADPAAPRLLDVVDTSTPILAVEYAPDGREVATGTATGTFLTHTVDPTDGTVSSPREFDLPGGQSVAVTYSDDGRLLLTAGASRTLRLWDRNRMVPVVDRASDGSSYNYFDAAFSPDGSAVALATSGREVARLTVTADGGVVDEPAIGGFGSYVNGVDFSADGSRLVAGSSDLSTRIFDTETMNEVMNLPGPALVVDTQFSSDGTTLVTSDQDGTVRLWPLPGPVLDGPQDSVFTTPTDRTGATMVAGVGRRGNGARIWDTTDPTTPVQSEVAMSPDPGSVLTGASAVSPDGTVAALGTSDGGFDLWSTSDPAMPTRLASVDAALPGLIGGIAFDRTGSVLALSQQDASEVALWSVGPDPRELSRFEIVGLPSVIASSPSAPILAMGTSSETVELWDFSDPRSPRRLSPLTGFATNVASVGFSPDGTLLAAGSTDATVQVWDVESADKGRPRLLSTVAAESAITSTVFDHSGSRLGAGTDVGALWLWDVTTPTEPKTYATLTATGARVFDLAFLPGDDRVVGGGIAKSLHVWDIDVERVVSDTCRTMGSPLSEAEWNKYLPGVSYRDVC
ncbi:MAG: WD40 repeat domain-containing protein, partial [Rhodococcus sp. (in: high G+C Gram-positive bacteria)]